jgi:hypothetical protein
MYKLDAAHIPDHEMLYLAQLGVENISSSNIDEK